MIADAIGEDAAKSIFLSSMAAGLMSEKQAQSIVVEMEKDAAWGDLLKTLSALFSGGKQVASTGWDVVKSVPPILAATAIGGAGVGTLGAMGYDVLKERLSREDPQTKFNEDVEAMYREKEREQRDAKWITKVRTMRDELVRGAKTMPIDEYRTKYNALMDALDERRA